MSYSLDCILNLVCKRKLAFFLHMSYLKQSNSSEGYYQNLLPRDTQCTRSSLFCSKSSNLVVYYEQIRILSSRLCDSYKHIYLWLEIIEYLPNYLPEMSLLIWRSFYKVIKISFQYVLEILFIHSKVLSIDEANYVHTKLSH